MRLRIFRGLAWLTESDRIRRAVRSRAVWSGWNDCDRGPFSLSSFAMNQEPRRTQNSEVQLQRLQARAPAPMPDWMLRPLRVLPAVLAFNSLVFILWWLARGDEAFFVMMRNNFVVSWEQLAQGRFWTLLTAAFSHRDWWHFGLNMIVAWSFGSVLERLIGWRRFLWFYLGSALFSSLAHCVVSLMMGQPGQNALGASGAVSALLLAYALLFPHARILVFGVIPLPALVGALFFVGLDVWGLFAQGHGGGLPIGHGAHLGGAFAGWVVWWTVLRRRFAPPVRQRSAEPDNLSMNMTAEEASAFDRLRRKLSVEGPDALTVEEQEFLQAIRRRALR